MKTKLLAILLLFFLTQCRTVQVTTEVGEWGSCEDGERLARADSASGELKVILYGLPSCGARRAKYEAMLSEKGIATKDVGCDFYAAYDCYNEIMAGVIAEKYGNNFFENLNAELDSLHLCEELPPPEPVSK